MSEREILLGQAEIQPLVIEKPVPQLGRLLWRATYGEPERVEEIIQKSRRIESNYLAHEAVRKGERAGLIVGNIFANGIRIPYTGLEPYTVGSGLEPEEIIHLEVEVGCKALSIINKSGVRYLFHQNLEGKKADPEIVTELSSIYGAIVARFRAMGESDTSSFRTETYSGIRSVPNIVYTIDGTDLQQKIVVPRSNPQVFQRTEVDLTEKLLLGYMLVAELGRFGHPLAREAVKAIN